MHRALLRVSWNKTVSGRAGLQPCLADISGRSCHEIQDQVKEDKIMRDKMFMRFMTLPALLVFLLMGVYPTIQGLLNSFTSYNMTETAEKEFIGIDNYVQMLTEMRFWQALGRTLVFVVLSVGLSYMIGLVIAVLLNKINAVRNVYRIIFLIPMIIAPTITALNFKFMYNYNMGIINFFLNLAGIPNVDFLGNPSLALFSTLAVDIWLGTPLAILILLAGIESQSEAYYEAAKIDGASEWQIFSEITFPILKKFSVIVIVLRTMDALKVYEVIQLMTAGGPGTSSETLNIYISKAGFSWFEMGYAAALGIFALYFIMFIAKFIINKTGLFQSEVSRV